jgi:hypothetical protein
VCPLFRLCTKNIFENCWPEKNLRLECERIRDFLPLRRQPCQQEDDANHQQQTQKHAYPIDPLLLQRLTAVEWGLVVVVVCVLTFLERVSAVAACNIRCQGKTAKYTNWYLSSAVFFLDEVLSRGYGLPSSCWWPYLSAIPFGRKNEKSTQNRTFLNLDNFGIFPLSPS